MKNAARISIPGFVLFSLLTFLGTKVTHANNTASVLLDSASSQTLVASDTPSLSVTGNMTLEAWVKLTTLPTVNQTYVLVDKTTSTSADSSYQLNVENRGGQQYIGFGVNNTGHDYAWSPSANTWYHIAVAYDTSGSASVYVDGAFTGVFSGFTTSIQDSTADFTIGGTRGVAFLNGNIDDVRVYTVARTQSQIQSDMFMEPTGTETGLVAAWNLDNNYSDSTSNNNTLAPVNGPVFSVDVPPTSLSPSINSFSATPSSITQGQNSVLAWSIDNATTVSIDHGIGVVTGTSTTVAPVQTTTYTLTATNATGTSTAQATVIVTAGPDSALKTANQSVSSNATLQNDTQLLLQLQPGSYVLDGLVIASTTSATPDIKIAFSNPAGSDMNIGYVAASGSSSAGGVLQKSSTASVRIPLPANTPTPVMIHGTIIVTIAGILQLQWGQFTSNAKTVDVARGSYLKVTHL